MMCHQVIQVFECGHSNNAKKVPCGKPSNCGQEVFLRQELEDIKPESSFRMITFASYGRAGRNINDPLTPHHISARQNISFNALDHGDQIAVGLLLTKVEFDDKVVKVFNGHYSDVPFLDSVFNITRGHVGACEDFLRIICTHEVTRHLG